MNHTFMIVNTIGLVLVVFVLWWFFGAKHYMEFAKADEPIFIMVKDGVYMPALISVPAGKVIRLRFRREDASACASTVIFTQLHFSYQLPLNQMVDIVLPPQKKSEIDFTCQMGMYRGKVMVV